MRDKTRLLPYKYCIVPYDTYGTDAWITTFSLIIVYQLDYHHNPAIAIATGVRGSTSLRSWGAVPTIEASNALSVRRRIDLGRAAVT